MRTDEALVLCEFNRWANVKLLEVAASLTEEMFTRDLGNSFPSLRDTLVHILSAEWVWLQRWKGSSPAAMPAGWTTLGIDGVRKALDEVEAEQLEFVRALSADALEAEVRYRNFAGEARAEPLGWLLRHVVNHSSYHRGQVTTLLRQLGVKAVSTDLVQFYREQVQPLAAGTRFLIGA